MKKIPTLFVRNPEDRRYVLPEVTPGCEWVLAGEGVATRKYDGTCILLSLRGPHARREVKPGKTPPPNWVEVGYDEVTGKRVGWEPIEQSPFRTQFAEAYEACAEWQLGTYELVGPKINGNPERTESHELIRHADAVELTFATGQDDAPGDPKGFWHYMQGFMSSLRSNGVEGIVWHHPDGRMAKLKARDFPTERDGEAQR